MVARQRGADIQRQGGHGAAGAHTQQQGHKNVGADTQVRPYVLMAHWTIPLTTSIESTSLPKDSPNEIPDERGIHGRQDLDELAWVEKSFYFLWA